MGDSTSRETVAQVLADLQDFVAEAFSTHAWARFGLLHEHDLLMQMPAGEPGKPETATITIHVGPDSEPFPPYSTWTVIDARALTDPNGGPVHLRLGHQFVVFLLAGWEHEYRPRLAAAHGCDAGDIKVPVIGDLRLMRNDIIHHHAIATSSNSGRCQVLRHWVTIGDAIDLGPEQLAELWAIFPWSDLKTPPSSDGADPSADLGA